MRVVNCDGLGAVQKVQKSGREYRLRTILEGHGAVDDRLVQTGRHLVHDLHPVRTQGIRSIHNADDVGIRLDQAEDGPDIGGRDDFICDRFPDRAVCRCHGICKKVLA